MRIGISKMRPIIIYLRRSFMITDNILPDRNSPSPLNFFFQKIYPLNKIIIKMYCIEAIKPG